MECQDTHTRNTTTSSTSLVQGDNQVTLPTLVKTLPPLVDLQSSPTSALVMETFQSNIINKETQKSSAVDPLTA